MSQVQQLLWELEMDYIGHPYYMSGNAILHALGPHLDPETHAALSASHGVFVPGQFGTFPDEHSESGVFPYLGASLPEVTAYDDLFCHRKPTHPWLLESRARDALNTHDLRIHGGHPTLAHETMMGRRPGQRKHRQTTRWYVHAYLHADGAILPLDEDALDQLSFGGKRNYGYGVVTLKETRTISLDELDYSRLADHDAYRIELVTPFVLESTYPGTPDRDVPWWWAESRDALRLREEKILENGDVYDLVVVDHGQCVHYTGDRPIETAKNGLTRVGTHSRYGFGELRLRPHDARTSNEDIE